MSGDYLERLRAAVDDDEDVLAVMWELYPKLREDLRAGVDELEQLRAEHTALGRAEHQWRIVTPNGPVHSFTQRDLDDHANWLPGVRLEQRTVYGTPWEPADPKQMVGGE